MDLIAVCCEMCYVTSEKLEYMKWELIEVGAKKRVVMPEAITVAMITVLLTTSDGAMHRSCGGEAMLTLIPQESTPSG